MHVGIPQLLLRPWTLPAYLIAAVFLLIGSTLASRQDGFRVLRLPERTVHTSSIPRSVTSLPDVLAAGAMPAAQAASARVPIPFPALPSKPVLPDWVRSNGETPLWAAPTSKVRPVEKLPKGTFLKVVGLNDDRLRVRFGGDGLDRREREGWVDPFEVAVAGAPGWVKTASAADVKASDQQNAAVVAMVPARATVQVLDDLGEKLRVFYLGNGHKPGPTEGWVSVRDVAPAGPMLASAGRGVRLLAKQDVLSLTSGDGVWLDVPHRSQFDGSPSEGANCGPTSLGMVLEHYRQRIPTAEVRSVAERLQGTSDHELGFAIEYLEATTRGFGLDTYDLYASREVLRRWKVEDLRLHLSRGHPVIPELRFRSMPGRAEASSPDDHYIVLTGLRGNDFIYNDSADMDAPGYGRVISSEELVRAWSRSYFPYAAFAVSGP